MKFLDPQGYYWAWDRCCRPHHVKNIANPELSGMVLLTEFPALGVGGNRVPFSSPEMPFPNGLSACLNQAFSMDFAATMDTDGDNLVYELVRPYKGNNTPNNPLREVQAGPYSGISWARGYNDFDMIHGSPPLEIGFRTGLLSITPNEAGFFSFAIVCKKYRFGKLVGSTLMEFSLQVEACPQAQNNFPINTPTVLVNGKAISQITICPRDTITFSTADSPEWAFQWQKNGFNIANAQSPILKVSGETGVFSVVKSAKNACVPDSSSKNIYVIGKNVVASPNVYAEQSHICEGDSVRIYFNPYGDQVNYNYVWAYQGKPFSQYQNLQSFYVKKSGWYTLRAVKTDRDCGSTADSTFIETVKRPSISKPLAFYEICPEDSVRLTVQPISDALYRWYDADKKLVASGSKPAMFASKIGTYTLTVNLSGCETQSAPFTVQSKLDCLLGRLRIPTAFSPNGDGLNDVWHLFNLENNPDSEIWIYNRWGEIIFYSKGYDQPWNGTYREEKVPMGVYTYKIRTHERQYQGNVFVLY